MTWRPTLPLSSTRVYVTCKLRHKDELYQKNKVRGTLYTSCTTLTLFCPLQMVYLRAIGRNCKWGGSTQEPTCSFHVFLQAESSSAPEPDRRKAIDSLLTNLKTSIGSVKDTRDKALAGDVDMLFSGYGKLINALPRSYTMLGGASTEETAELKTKVMPCTDFCPELEASLGLGCGPGL